MLFRSDEHFSDYTLLFDTSPSFSSPDFNYTNTGVANTTRTPDSPLLANTLYYWRVIAYDVFGTSTNSTNDFVYITDTIAPAVTLNAPQNNGYMITPTAEFNYTPTDTNTIDTCILYANFSGSFAPNATNSSISSGFPNYLTTTLDEGAYIWNVWCNDSAQNSNFSSANRTIIVDLTPPDITLISPQDGKYENTTNNVVFTINASDVWAEVSNCSLIIDGAVEQTQSDILEGEPSNFKKSMLNRTYTWSVNGTNTNDFENASQTLNITVEVVDANPPLVTLNFPRPNYHSSVYNITFNYTAEDATGIENCSLYIDTILNDTDTQVENFVSNYFNVSGIPEGAHNWTVECFDNSTDKNLGVSGTNVLTIDRKSVV